MLWRLGIGRPVGTLTAFLILAIFGGFAYWQMPVRENPDVEFPIVSVNVVFFGAEPEVIESEVIEPLEERLNTVEGLKTLTATARAEVASIVAEFELWRDIDVATQEVRDRVDRALRELPEEIEPPIVRKLDPDSQPIMWIALTGGPRWDAVKLTRYADQRLKEQLENLRGVGRVLIGGERLFAVRVELDPTALAAHKVTVQDVVATIRDNNVKIPAGRVESRTREFLIDVQGLFSSAEPLNDLIITEGGDGPVRIRDVGAAVAGVENDRQLARFQGTPSVGLGVVKQRDANTVALAQAVRGRMADLATEFPPGLRHQVATDASRYIRTSVRDLIFTVALTAALVTLVIYLFLGSWSGTVISAAAIPVSLLGGVALIYALGFSINVLTLLAFILAIGIVIDDAVVVIESAARELDRDLPRAAAAQQGTAKVAFPNLANTLALAAVFVPVAFTQGLIGRFFQEFSLTVAMTVAVSTATALTLTPMLCARLLRTRRPTNQQRGAPARRLLDQSRGGYTWLLDRVLRHKVLTLVATTGLVALAVWSFRQLDTEFMPDVDRAEFMVRFEGPEGATLQATDAFGRQLDAIIGGTPEVTHRFYAIGLARGAGPGRVNEGLIFVHLTPRTERTATQQAVMQRVRARFAEVPGGRGYVMFPSTSIGGRGAPLQLVLQHPEIDTLAAQQAQLMDWMRQQPEFEDVRSNLKVRKPELELRIRRDKASTMDISVRDIADTLRLLLGQPEVSEIERRNERYEVIPQVTLKGDMSPAELGKLYVRSDSGALISLASLTDWQTVAGPSEIHHYNRLRAATVSASPPPDVPLGVALSTLRTHLAETLPADTQWTVAGRAEDFRKAFYYLTIALAFAVVFVYLVLAAQFESFLQPLVIMTALPPAAVGALSALWLADMTFNIYSFIGLIMLVGMATKNGILLVDYANQQRAAGEADVDAAMRAAARIRFRPVIMTTLSTVLGLLPIALGFGAGGTSRAPLGVAVSAGLLVTTLLTLLVLPVGYSLLTRLELWLARRLGATPAGEPATAA